MKQRLIFLKNTRSWFPPLRLCESFILFSKKEAEKEAKKLEKEAKKLQKEIQQQIEKGIVKPDSINAEEILKQTMPPVKKKEPVKTIEVKEEIRVETPIADQFAPIPITGSQE